MLLNPPRECNCCCIWTELEMSSLGAWARYVMYKLEYTISLTHKSYQNGLITEKEIGDNVWKNLFHGRLTTILRWNKGAEMVPTIGQQGTTLLVRKIPYVNSTHVFVGDVVFMRDPERSNKYLVRRLAAIEGHEMVSTDPKDTPFVIEDGQCWVLSDNESLKPKEARDSRTFGPIPMTNILGRIIYTLQSAVDHGPIKNSHAGMLEDGPILAMELDVDEMARNHKA